MADPRAVAVDWLTQVVGDGKSVNQLLAETKPGLTPQQTPLAKQLLFGCLRHYHELQTVTDTLLSKAFKKKDLDLQMVLVSGLYQLKYLSTPDHAAISESVELARKLGKSWATGLVNGVLRRYQRESQSLAESLQKSLQFRYSHPGWMVKQLFADWPNDADAILDSNNQQAPMTIRVNTRLISREAYLQQLDKAGLQGEAHPLAKDGIVLTQAIDVFQLPGFSQGLVTVQDAAAQLAIEMLDLQAGQRVLDGCAAPGGKTSHILQRQPAVDLLAVEMSASRALRIEQTLERLQMTCQLVTADLSEPAQWWDGKLFDRILLDVPCSASGVIRRHPDIKIHRRVTDLAPLVLLQQKLLEQCWQVLRPGGKLVYATCSLFKAENADQLQHFLTKHPAELLKMPDNIHAGLSPQNTIGYQIFPGEQQMDGFYLCGLKKPDEDDN